MRKPKAAACPDARRLPFPAGSEQRQGLLDRIEATNARGLTRTGEAVQYSEALQRVQPFTITYHFENVAALHRWDEQQTQASQAAPASNGYLHLVAESLLVTRQEAAAILHCSPSTIDRFRRRRVLVPRMRGRFFRSDVEALAAQGVEDA